MKLVPVPNKTLEWLVVREPTNNPITRVKLDNGELKVVQPNHVPPGMMMNKIRRLVQLEQG